MQSKIKKTLTMSLAVFALSCAMVFLDSHNSFAAAETTLTWVGTACNVESSGEAACKWNVMENWEDEDGNVPVSITSPAAGEELFLVFDIDSMKSVYMPTNNIPGLIVDGISFIRSKSTKNPEGRGRVSFSSDVAPVLSLRGDMTNDTPVPAVNTLYAVEIMGNIKLLSDSYFDRIDSIQSGSAGVPEGTHTSSVDLNGNTLSIDNSKTVFNLNRMRITGNGTVAYLPDESLSGHEVYGKNTYIGKTEMHGRVRGIVGVGYNSFGDSVMSLHSGAYLHLSFDGNVTEFNNTIIMYPRSDSTEEDYSTIIFMDTTGAVKTPNRTIKVPNIELKGHVYMDNSQWYADNEDSYVIDLAGIKHNNHPIWYGGSKIASTHGFINGPLGATIEHGVSVDVTPSGGITVDVDTADTTENTPAKAAVKAPNTGVTGLIMANPIAASLMGLISSVVLIGAFKRKFNI